MSAKRKRPARKTHRGDELRAAHFEALATALQAYLDGIKADAGRIATALEKLAHVEPKPAPAPPQRTPQGESWHNGTACKLQIAEAIHRERAGVVAFLRRIDSGHTLEGVASLIERGEHLK